MVTFRLLFGFSARLLLGTAADTVVQRVCLGFTLGAALGDVIRVAVFTGIGTGNGAGHIHRNLGGRCLAISFILIAFRQIYPASRATSLKQNHQ